MFCYNCSVNDAMLCEWLPKSKMPIHFVFCHGNSFNSVEEQPASDQFLMCQAPTDHVDFCLIAITPE